MQLEINGSKWQLSWGMGALENLCDELDLTLQEIDIELMTNETRTLNKLTYCALRNGAELKDTSLDFSYKFFLDWLDNADEKTGAEISADFMQSKLLGKTMEARFNEIIERLNANEPESAEPIKKKNTRSVKSSVMPISGD